VYWRPTSCHRPSRVTHDWVTRKRPVIRSPLYRHADSTTSTRIPLSSPETTYLEALLAEVAALVDADPLVPPDQEAPQTDDADVGGDEIVQRPCVGRKQGAIDLVLQVADRFAGLVMSLTPLLQADRSRLR
jgi:hypothetical protein